MDEIISCIIPAYNLSRDCIYNTINRLPQEINVVLVCHNEYVPNRIKSFDAKSKNKYIQIITIPFQVGKSEAVRYGIDFILNEYKNCNILSQIDGDLKQYPEEIGGMLYNFRQKRISMIIGNRYAFSDLKKQTHRIAAINWVSSIIKCVTGYQIVDTLCGMRVYSRELAEQFLKIRSFGYGLELEQILIAGKLKFHIDNHPIHSNIQLE
jgi:hypothetical protein